MPAGFTNDYVKAKISINKSRLNQVIRGIIILFVFVLLLCSAYWLFVLCNKYLMLEIKPMPELLNTAMMVVPGASLFIIIILAILKSNNKTLADQMKDDRK